MNERAQALHFAPKHDEAQKKTVSQDTKETRTMGKIKDL